jgi:1-acyl-sn-glycerol-3-phosphate acyltransferase
VQGNVAVAAVARFEEEEAAVDHRMSTREPDQAPLGPPFPSWSPPPYLRLVPPPSVGPATAPRPALPGLLAQRDPELIRRIFPWLAAFTDSYFRSEVEGLEHLRPGAFLGVATHNGGINFPDIYCLMVAFWRRLGLEAPAYGLMHRMAFAVPLLGDLLVRLGGIPASNESARVALENGFPLFVCPGGDVDALKPFRDRHRVIFGERRGFIRLALRHQVPIIPIISVGAHETLLFLNDGRRLAEVTGAARYLRIKSIPFALSFPFGLTIAGLGAVPLPSKITLRILPPIELAEGPAAADDEAAVLRCREHVRSVMQRALDDLAARRRWPVLG